MKRIECLNEVSIWLDDENHKREHYEDGFGYIYEVADDKAKKLLAMKDPSGNPCFRVAQ